MLIGNMFGSGTKNTVFFCDPERKNGYLSPLYPASFDAEGETFCCAMQYYVYRKACMFGDATAADAILTETDPTRFAELGKTVKGTVRAVWNAVRMQCMTDALLLAFSQNEEIGRLLLSTGDALIVDCDPFDTVWGSGMLSVLPGADDPEKWKGENLLGFSLMIVREKLQGAVFRSQCKVYFVITGDFDPAAVTEALKISPYKFHTKDALRRDGRPYGFAMWQCAPAATYAPETARQMEEAILPLRDKIDALNALRESGDVAFSLRVVPELTVDGVHPALAPSDKVIAFCHETKTALDIDLYLYEY